MVPASKSAPAGRVPRTVDDPRRRDCHVQRSSCPCFRRVRVGCGRVPGPVPRAHHQRVPGGPAVLLAVVPGPRPGAARGQARAPGAVPARPRAARLRAGDGSPTALDRRRAVPVRRPRRARRDQPDPGRHSTARAVESQRRTVLHPLEFAAVLTAARRHSAAAHALAALLGMLGLRVSEACGVHVTDLQYAGGYEVLHVLVKGAKPATIPLPIPVLRAVGRPPPAGRPGRSGSPLPASPSLAALPAGSCSASSGRPASTTTSAPTPCVARSAPPA